MARKNMLLMVFSFFVVLQLLTACGSGGSGDLDSNSPGDTYVTVSGIVSDPEV